MKHLPALCALTALLGLSACNSSPNAHNHWDGNYVTTSVTRAFFGWYPQNSTETGEYLSKDANDFGLVIRRHVLNDNPRNPLQHGD